MIVADDISAMLPSYCKQRNIFRRIHISRYLNLRGMSFLPSATFCFLMRILNFLLIACQTYNLLKYSEYN